jgi:hypothetical protein
MIRRGWRRRVLSLVATLAVATVGVFTAPTAASADTLRPLTVSLFCWQSGLPYGYAVNTGSGWYTPQARSDATVSGDTKTFYLLIPTTATSLAVNSYCDGFQGALFEGYTYGISPGTSTVNASGNVNTYQYSPGFGVIYYFTYVTLSSISYS